MTKNGSATNAAFCFRKAVSPVTEDNLQADTSLIFEMMDRKIRVQDLLDYLNSPIDFNKALEITNLCSWYRKQQAQNVKI